MATAAPEAIEAFVRVRQLLPREDCPGTTVHWVTTENTIANVDGSKSFCFDRVFSPDDTNETVYNIVGKKIVESAIRGINATIFAYGQTGSGNYFCFQLVSEMYLTRLRILLIIT
jgi:hypothetical protein